MGKHVELKAADGHKFDAYVAEPAGKPKGLIIIAPEIFGVNSHIRSVTDGYAAEGYLAIAPAFFDRAQTKYEAGYTPEDIAAGVELMKKSLSTIACRTLMPPSSLANLLARWVSLVTAGAESLPG